MEISFIGSGNVASHLAYALSQYFDIRYILSSRLESAQELAVQVNAVPTEEYNKLITSNLIIICVPDDVIIKISNKLSQVNNKAIVVHVSGSKGAELLQSASKDFGVFYPLQTFTKGKTIDISRVPFFINGNSQKVIDTLITIGQKLSDQVHILSDEKRMHLHIAAVIANNFTNHLLYQTKKILTQKNLKLEYLEPLIHETISKAITIDPYEAQTGPAKRKDHEVIEAHLSYLNDYVDLKELYSHFTKSIKQTYENR
jgi:predicted short-subunit dehydrogenase-like oxidoreductase (DUF2520 family)